MNKWLLFTLLLCAVAFLGHDSALGQNMPATGLTADFETNDAPWTSTGLWHRVATNSPCGHASSPIHSWYFGDDTTCMYDTGVSHVGILTSPLFVVPALEPRLTFQSRERTEGFYPFDTRKIYLRRGAASRILLHQSYNEGTNWNQIGPIDLQPYAGEEARLEFEFDTVDDAENQFSGWYIDDVSVTSLAIAIRHTPLADRSSLAPIPVQAEVVAQSSVASMKLVWRVGLSAYTTQSMQSSGADQYQATIPARAVGDIVRYYLEATDSSGALVRKPDDAPATTYQFQVQGVPNLAVGTSRLETVVQPGENREYLISLTNSGNWPVRWAIREHRPVPDTTPTGSRRYPAARPPIDWELPHAPDTLLVCFDEEVPDEQRASIHAAHEAKRIHSFSLIPVDVVQAPAHGDLQHLSRVYAESPSVRYVEPNYLRRTCGQPNDPGFFGQWALHNTGQFGGLPDADIDAVEAWDRQLGSKDIVVAVIDTGIDFNHEDLQQNLWINEAEATGLDGVDDDGNGFVDDIHGATWIGGDGTPTDGVPLDGHGHGTHISGTIGAVGNNGIGIAGINHAVRIMSLKFLADDGSGYDVDAIAALEYAVEMGAQVTNNSWGGSGFNLSLRNAIAAAGDLGQLFVAAAGNDGVDIDLIPTYPAAYNVDTIIAVTATDDSDALTYFSNWGRNRVHLAAPGVSILGTTLFNTYRYFSGTSMSTAQVTGVVALLLAQTVPSGMEIGGEGQSGVPFQGASEELHPGKGVLLHGDDFSLDRGSPSGDGSHIILPPDAASTDVAAESVVADPLAVKEWILESVDTLDELRVAGPTPVASEGRLNAAAALERAGVPWLEFASAATGTLSPGATTNVRLTVSGEDLADGFTDTGLLTITSSDPNSPNNTVPVTLTVAQFLAVHHTPHLDTNDTVGPYPICAEVQSVDPIDLSQSRLYYKTTSQTTFQPIPLTVAEEGALCGAIPGHALGSTIQYYLLVRDTTGHTGASPAEAPAVVHSFAIGVPSLAVRVNTDLNVALRSNATRDLPAAITLTNAGFGVLTWSAKLKEQYPTAMLAARSAALECGGSTPLSNFAERRQTLLRSETKAASSRRTPKIRVANQENITREILVNGDFETGDLTGWSVANTGDGAWVVNDGAFRPASGDPAFAPCQDEFAVITDMEGPGRHVLYQEITIPDTANGATLSWTDRIRNHAEDFIHPDQEFRVELWNTENQTIAQLFSTHRGDESFSGCTQRSVDISEFAGNVVRVVFIEEDSLLYLNVHLDRVSVTVTEPLWLLVHPASGTLNPGQSIDLSATFDSAGKTAPATLLGRLIMTSNDPSGIQSIPVSMNVMNDDMVLLPATPFVATGPVGGPFAPDGQSWSLYNLGTTAISWTAHADQDWLTLSPASGTLAAGGSSGLSAHITAAATALPSGVYEDEIIVANLTNGGQHIRTVTLTVQSTPGEIDVVDCLPPEPDRAMPFPITVVGSLTSACVTIANNGAGALTVTDVSLAAGWYNEEFEEEPYGWSEDFDASWQVVAGEYRARGVGEDFMTAVYADRQWDNVSVAATLRRVGAGTTAAGVLLRASPDMDLDGIGSTYLFQIAANGSFSVWKVIAGEAQPLQDWTPSAAIRADTNRLRASANEHVLVFVINDMRVWSGVDFDLSRGHIGVAGYTEPELFTTHFFDDLVVDEVEEEQISFGYQDFELSSIPNLPITLAPDESLSFDVLFHPATTGHFANVVRVQSNDPASPRIDLSVTGDGVSVVNVDHLPLSDTTELGPFPVSATITAPSGVLSAALWWRNQGDPAFASTSLAPAGGGVFAGTIPTQLAGRSVDYYLQVTDHDGNAVTHPSGAPTTTHAFSILDLTVGLDDDFDGDELGWIGSGLWHRTDGADPCSSSHSSPRSWHYGDDATCTYETGSVNAGVLRSPRFVVPLLQPTLTFWSWEQIEEDGQFDTRKIYVRGTDGTRRLLHQTPANTVGWRQIGPIGLADVSGEIIALEFEFHTVDPWNNEFAGWLIDDVAIAGATIEIQHEPLRDTKAEGDYLITATVRAVAAINSVTLSWRTEDMALHTVDMARIPDSTAASQLLSESADQQSEPFVVASQDASFVSEASKITVLSNLLQTEVSTTEIRGSVYTASIPQQAVGTVIHYYLSVVDGDGNTARHPATPEGTHRFQVQGIPVLSVTPATIDVRLLPDGRKTQSIVLRNTGNWPAHWRLVERHNQHSQGTGGARSIAMEADPPPIDWQTPRAPDTLLVRFKPSAMRSDRSAVHQRCGGQTIRSSQLLPLDVVRVPPGYDLATVRQSYLACPEVAAAEPNYRRHAYELPNDSRFSDLWGLHNTGQTGGTPDADIDALEAWDSEQGNRAVVVAVIDTGVDYHHEDLVGNMWTNDAELHGVAGVDDDGNGIVDDIHGAAWTGGTGQPTSGDPFDDHNHGTHVAGTIGAVGGNGRGVVGVNHAVRIMALKFLNAQGIGYDADAIAAIEYAVAMGAHVMNASWGGGDFSATTKSAIEQAGAAGLLFVAAAGNESSSNDSFSAYPASYVSPTIVAVAASDHRDRIASFSNWGLETVDLAAPGVTILSTLPNNRYGNLSGTSMATPHVTGVAAMLLAHSGNGGVASAVAPEVVKSWILDGVDPVAAFATDGPSPVLTGGRLNAANALALSGIPWLDRGAITAGILAPDASIQLEITVDAAGLPDGFADEGIVAIVSDAAVPDIDVAVTLEVADSIAIQHTGRTATNDTEGPYAICAQITSPGGVNINELWLYYRLSSDSEFMRATLLHVTGAVYCGEIPGQPVGTEITYYLSAAAMDGAVKVNPPQAPMNGYRFRIGTPELAVAVHKPLEVLVGPDESWTLAGALTLTNVGFGNLTWSTRLMEDAESGIAADRAALDPFKPAVTTNPLINGDFETGDLTGWSVVHSPNGQWTINDGDTIPASGAGPVFPCGDSYDAFSDTDGPGIHTLFQDVQLPEEATRVVVSWTHRIDNQAGIFFDPDQGLRVELWDADNQLLRRLFATKRGDAPVQGCTTKAIDITEFVGQRVHIAFTVENRLDECNAYIDNVALQIELPDWLTPDPNAGVLTIAGSVDLALTFSGSGLTAGDERHGRLIIETNGLGGPTILPVHLRVVAGCIPRVPPVISLGATLGGFECGTAINRETLLANVSAVDDCGTDITAGIDVTGALGILDAGAYTFSYRVTDSTGGVGTATRNISVDDTQVPIITAIPGLIRCDIGADVALLDGVTATDNCDGEVTPDVCLGTVDTLRGGTYRVTYCVADRAGNQGTAVRDYVVPMALDVDSNGLVEGDIDGMIIMRYLFGFRGAALTAGICPACDAAKIEQHLDTVAGAQ